MIGNLEFTEIECPDCGVKVDADRANEMVRQEFEHIAIEKLRTQLEQDTSETFFTLKPGPEFPKPAWEFYVEIKEKFMDMRTTQDNPLSFSYS